MVNGELAWIDEEIAPEALEALAHYRRLLQRTGNEQYARRIAFGTRFRVPGYVGSAQSFQRQAHANGETVGQMFRKDPQGLAELKREAAKMGISVSDDDTYHRCLANRGGRPDPDAVVPHDDPRAHIEKLARQRGHAVGGMVQVEAVQHDPVPDDGQPIAEDIVQNLMRERVEQDPGLVATPAKAKKLREDVITRHAPQPSCCGDSPPDIGDLL